MARYLVTVEVKATTEIEVEVEAVNEEEAFQKAEQEAGDTSCFDLDDVAQFEALECELLPNEINLDKAKWQNFNIGQHNSNTYHVVKGLPVKLGGFAFFVDKIATRHYRLSCQRTGCWLGEDQTLPELINKVRNNPGFLKLAEGVEKAVEMYGETPYWKAKHPQPALQAIEEE